MTEITEAVERLRETAYRDEAKAVTARSDDLRALLSELTRLQEEVKGLRLAICGGEDAPGYADSLPLADILGVAANNIGSWREASDRAALLQAAREEASQGAGEPVAMSSYEDGWFADPLAALTSPPTDPRTKALEGERDAWKTAAEHHFAHMRAALDLSYHLRYPPCPMLLDQVADLIDCGDGCENAWREHDTNATGCTRSESAEGCPFEMACELRDFAKALRIQAWTLAFAPRAALTPSVQAEKGDDHGG
ncbi:hypothetical protein [Phenylobacterium sp.]|uniref:hypothetical protein n=1 Tax=Phenylobacterium sp. TaxID=1871053 RepID=UPI00272F5D40|nr:hypothetical protein [Phenylobacterium sp.]MDP1873701.1 hypothetical protein [Phenylobacterium sp.]